MHSNPEMSFVSSHSKLYLTKKRKTIVAKSIFSELNKITLAIWVDKVLNLSLTKQNIKVGFNVISKTFQPKSYG
jgi:hypothetical protein